MIWRKRHLETRTSFFHLWSPPFPQMADNLTQPWSDSPSFCVLVTQYVGASYQLVFWDLFGLFLVVFHKSLCFSFIKQRRRKILLANLYMEANILHWPSTACAITTVHKLHCLPTLTKKHHPYEAEHQIKLTSIRKADKKAFVSAMQRSCWYFWLHYHIQRAAISLHSFGRLSVPQ